MTIQEWQTKIRTATDDNGLENETYIALVELGMVVATLSEKLEELSEMVLPGYFADSPNRNSKEEVQSE